MKNRDLNLFIRSNLHFLLKDDDAILVFSRKSGIPEKEIRKWMSGKHDFRLSEVAMLEHYFQIELLDTPSIESQESDPAINKHEYIEIGLRDLSVRGQHALRKIYDACPDTDDFIRQLVKIKNDPSVLPNVGKRTSIEINNFINFITHSESTKNVNFSEGLYSSLARQLALKFQLEVDFCQSVAEHILQKKPFLFGFIRDLIRYSKKYKVSLRGVLLEEIFDQGTTGKRLQYTAQKLQLTVERVRQLRGKVQYEIERLMSKLHSLIDSNLYFEIYPELFEKEYIAVDQNLTDSLNQREQVSFNPGVLGIVIHLMKGNKFSSVELKSGTVYIVPNAYVEFFDLHGFYDLLDEAIKLKRKTDEKVSFSRLIDKFLKKNNPLFEDEIRVFLEYLLKHEYGVGCDAEGFLILPVNAKKSLMDLAMEAVDKANQPIPLQEVYQYIAETSPDIKLNLGLVQSALLRNTNIITFSKTGTYGLKKWEMERPGIKGGSITSMIYQLLKKNEAPLHISEIEAYVQKYRDTNAKNIRGLMYMDVQKRFVQLGKGYFGLHDKRYAPISKKNKD